MRKLTQKLVLSVVTMALVVIALGTSTFAWFTLTNKASISAFEAQVTAGEGIEITLGTLVQNAGVDTILGTSDDFYVPTVDSNTIWYTVLPTSVIQDYISKMYTNFRFDNLTSANGSVIRNESLVTQSYSKSARFIEFTLYFRSSAAKEIVWSSATLSGDSQPWTVNVPTFKASDNSTDWVLNEVKNVAAWTGARVSIQGSSTYTYQAPSGLSSGTPQIYNSTTGVASYDLTLIDHDNDGGTPDVYAPGTAAYGAAAYGIQAGKNTTYGTVLPTIAGTTDINSSAQVVATLTGSGSSYTGNVVVRVWIEGFDADTFDAIFSSYLTVQLGFTANNI